MSIFNKGDYFIIVRGPKMQQPFGGFGCENHQDVYDNSLVGTVCEVLWQENNFIASKIVFSNIFPTIGQKISLCTDIVKIEPTSKKYAEALLNTGGLPFPKERPTPTYNTFEGNVQQ